MPRAAIAYLLGAAATAAALRSVHLRQRGCRIDVFEITAYVLFALALVLANPGC